MKSLTVAAFALAAIATASPAAAQAAECTVEYLTSTRDACDSLADVSQLKCDDEACHEALHELVEDDVRQCYVDLGLGPVTDLDYYVLLDDFCHGDGADPADLSSTAGSTAGSNSTGSGSGGAEVGDHDHDHDHDDEHEESAGSDSSSTSASAGSNGAASLSASLVALPLLALVATALHA